MPPEINVISFVLGFATLLIVVSVLVPMAKRVQVPFTVLLALVGIGLGFVQTAAGEAGGVASILVDAIGARNAGTDDLELLIGETGVV